MEVTAQELLIDISLLSVLLVVGLLIRSRVDALSRYAIPASVIGGVVGLILGHQVLDLIPTSDVYLDYTEILMQVVFAALFIGMVVPGIRDLVDISGAQATFAIFNNFGQIAIGMLVVLLFGLLGVSLHPAFGMQLVLAFQGGPGIPTAFGGLYESVGWNAEAASAVGESAAIAGLVLGAVIGIIMVNIAIRRGYLAEDVLQDRDSDESNEPESPSFVAEEDRSSIGTDIVSLEALSPLGYVLGIIGVAILAGNLLKMGSVQIIGELQFVPEFAYVLVTGLVLQVIIQEANLNDYVDRDTVRSVQGLALDLLIVAALSTIALDVVVRFVVPLTVMVVLGLAFNILWALYLAPIMLPGAWFEKSAAEFGQGTGAVPIALLLLRMVDPDLRTDAADAFGLKMFLTSPTMIPMIVFISPLVVSEGPLVILAAMVAGMVACLALARIVGWWYKRSVKWVVLPT